MAPNDDVERPRASSGAERQKSIVSMTEFDGMDEYTALQKYILFYRDAKVNPHAQPTIKTKKWWQFWKSGSAAAAPVADAGAVPDECKFFSPYPHPHPPAAHGAPSIAPPRTRPASAMPSRLPRASDLPTTAAWQQQFIFVVVEQQRPHTGH